LLWVAAPEQIVELRLAVGVEVDDLAVEDRGFGGQGGGQPAAKVAEGLVDIAAAGNEASVSASTYARARNPSYFSSNPVWVIERRVQGAPTACG
jgi:hypothetical protein